MSEVLSPWRAMAPPQFRPEMMIGAASPLWAYFTGAALSGVVLWWMTRWLPAARLQALGAATAETASEAVAEAVGGPVAKALVAAETPPFPVGGEAAPISPAVMAAHPDAAAGAAPEPGSPRRRPPERQAKPH